MDGKATILARGLLAEQRIAMRDVVNCGRAAAVAAADRTGPGRRGYEQLPVGDSKRRRWDAEAGFLSLSVSFNLGL